MVEAAIVGRDVVRVEEESFLYYKSCQISSIALASPGMESNIRLLKLVTGVDTSTRPARRLGRPGKTVNSSSRSAAAPPKRSAFCLSTAIVAQLWEETRHDEHGRHRGALVVSWRLGGPLPF